MAEPRPVEHECNAYCKGDIHARILYTDATELPEGLVAILAGGRRDDIVEIRPALEVPLIDPTDPLKREWAAAWLVLAREHKVE